jgi:hypothetical protein
VFVNWEAVGALGEVLGAAGVIGSLAYLAVQIRQNTRSVRAERYESIVSALVDLVSPMARDPELALIFQTAIEDWDAVSETDRSRLVFVLFTEFKLFENLYYQYRQGMLEPGLWDGWRRLMLSYHAMHGVRTWWNMRREAFSSDFRDFLESSPREESPLPTPWAITRESAHLTGR